MKKSKLLVLAVFHALYLAAVATANSWSADVAVLSAAERSARLSDAAKLWAGLEQQGYDIPRAGVSNRFLTRFGLTVEAHGQPVHVEGFGKDKAADFVAGTISTFGGPDDGHVSANERGAISNERLRALDSENRFYAAMRVDYGDQGAAGLKFWKGAKILVVNPKNGKAVVAQMIDWGPHPTTKRLIDVSEGVTQALGLKTDELVHVSFAQSYAPLGAVAK